MKNLTMQPVLGDKMLSLVKVMGCLGHKNCSNLCCLLTVGEKIRQKRGHTNWTLMYEEGFFKVSKNGKAFQPEGLASMKEQCHEKKSMFRK